jgi:hypothetical protein
MFRQQHKKEAAQRAVVSHAVSHFYQSITHLGQHGHQHAAASSNYHHRRHHHALTQEQQIRLRAAQEEQARQQEEERKAYLAAKEKRRREIELQEQKEELVRQNNLKAHQDLIATTQALKTDAFHHFKNALAKLSPLTRSRFAFGDSDQNLPVLNENNLFSVIINHDHFSAEEKYKAINHLLLFKYDYLRFCRRIFEVPALALPQNQDLLQKTYQFLPRGEKEPRLNQALEENIWKNLFRSKPGAERMAEEARINDILRHLPDIYDDYGHIDDTRHKRCLISYVSTAVKEQNAEAALHGYIKIIEAGIYLDHEPLIWDLILNANRNHGLKLVDVLYSKCKVKNEQSADLLWEAHNDEPHRQAAFKKAKSRAQKFITAYVALLINQNDTVLLEHLYNGFLFNLLPELPLGSTTEESIWKSLLKTGPITKNNALFQLVSSRNNFELLLRCFQLWINACNNENEILQVYELTEPHFSKDEKPIIKSIAKDRVLALKFRIAGSAAESKNEVDDRDNKKKIDTLFKSSGWHFFSSHRTYSDVYTMIRKNDPNALTAYKNRQQEKEKSINTTLTKKLKHETHFRL